MAEDSALDSADLDLVAALQLAPRAPFDVLARTLDSSSRTVARRYNRLVTEGVLQVICEVDWSLLAEGVPVNVWLDVDAQRIVEVGTALAERADTTYVAIASGRGDIYCVLHGMTRADTAQALTVEIPRIPGVQSMRVEWVLRRLTSSSAWRLPRLTEDQVDSLAAHVISAGETRNNTTLGSLERDAAALFRRDARAPFSDIARALGISESKARRTTIGMFASGLLRPRVEIEPRWLGYDVEAVLGIGCQPDAVDTVAAALRKHPSTRFLGITGSTRILTFDGVFRNEDELADVLVHGFGGGADITGIDCAMLVKVLKRYWLMRPLDGSDRQPEAPQ